MNGLIGSSDSTKVGGLRQHLVTLRARWEAWPSVSEAFRPYAPKARLVSRHPYYEQRLIVLRFEPAGERFEIDHQPLDD